MCQRNTVMITELAAITARHGPRRANHRFAAGRSRRATPIWNTARHAIAAVGGLRLLSGAPGVATIDAGYGPQLVRTARPVRAPVVSPSRRRRDQVVNVPSAYQYPSWWANTNTRPPLR